jgi:hypothetical protein
MCCGAGVYVGGPLRLILRENTQVHLHDHFDFLSQLSIGEFTGFVETLLFFTVHVLDVFFGDYV